MSARRTWALVLASVALALAGCAEQPLPEPSPRPAQEIVPVATGDQIDAVLERVGSTLAPADESLDPEALAAAVDGPALAQRTGAYLVQQRDPTQEFAVGLGTKRLQDVVPADQGWPRTLLTVTRSTPQDEAPDLMLLTQAAARAPFMLTAYTEMSGGTTLPLTEPIRDGVAVRAGDDGKGLALSPVEAVQGYADVLTKGSASPSAATFAESAFTQNMVKVQDDARRALTVDCEGCFGYEATHAPQADQLWAFSTQDGGALVMAAMDARMKITANEGYKTDLQAEFKAVSGATTITKVGEFAHIEVVALYIPPAGADALVQVLGVDRVPVSGKVS